MVLVLLRRPTAVGHATPYEGRAAADRAAALRATLETAAAALEAAREPTADLARATAARAALEALRVKTYALGCLAVALEAEDVASALVRDGAMAEIVTPLRRALVEGAPPPPRLPDVARAGVAK